MLQDLRDPGAILNVRLPARHVLEVRRVDQQAREANPRARNRWASPESARVHGLLRRGLDGDPVPELFQPIEVVAGQALTRQVVEVVGPKISVRDAIADDAVLRNEDAVTDGHGGLLAPAAAQASGLRPDIR
jgi:hypothetical protein